jgi:hypothetical protein
MATEKEIKLVKENFLALKKGNLKYKLTKKQIKNAKIISCFIRGDIEDFHCEHLSDSQMGVLNPLIRNAVVSALYMIDNSDTQLGSLCVNSQMFLNMSEKWEEPEMSDSFIAGEEIMELIEDINNKK